MARQINNPIGTKDAVSMNSKIGLERLIDSHKQILIRSFEKVIGKYEDIWQYYRIKMPSCITKCRNSYGSDVDGPQGIYWIGSNVKIFFVGLENYGWPQLLDYSYENIEYEPLRFFFYQTKDMQGFWQRINEITYRCINGNDQKEWHEVIDYIAVTNLCKCFCSKQQYHLYDRCWEEGFLKFELDTVDSPINVLFTNKYDIIDDITNSKSYDIHNNLIWKTISKGKVYYQLSHPSRLHTDVINILCNDIKNELTERNQVKD